MMDKFYEEGDVIIRRTKPSDIDHLSVRLRKTDVDEIWASHHVKPYEALREGFINSLVCLTVDYKKEPVAMFGICPVDLTGNKATIWFLASEKVNKIKNTFVKNSKKVVDFLLGFYPCLENFVDARNIKSIQWLKRCGAKISEASPFGIDKLPFHYFYFERT